MPGNYFAMPAFQLAAAYGFALARNHSFVDGNKRAAFLAVGVFLAMNGLRLTATPVDAIEAIPALASGNLDELQFADWIKRNLRVAADGRQHAFAFYRQLAHSSANI